MLFNDRELHIKKKVTLGGQPPTELGTIMARISTEQLNQLARDALANGELQHVDFLNAISAENRQLVAQNIQSLKLRGVIFSQVRAHPAGSYKPKSFYSLKTYAQPE